MANVFRLTSTSSTPHYTVNSASLLFDTVVVPLIVSDVIVVVVHVVLVVDLVILVGHSGR